MCNSKTVLQNINFATDNDQFNWLNTSENPLYVNENGLLVLSPTSNLNSFRRGLGNLVVDDNRILVKMNMYIQKGENSLSDLSHFYISLYNEAELIQRFQVKIEGLSLGIPKEYYFEREYKISDEFSGSVSMRIEMINGADNNIMLEYLNITSYQFCQENIRTYFSFPNIIAEIKNSTSWCIKLLEYKVDDVETLTQDFFDEITTDQFYTDDLKLAKSRIDGRERVEEEDTPNTFNPFAVALGLEYDTNDSFYGGKPLDTTSGSNYGNGIMQIGFDKPTVLNGLGQSVTGAFFLDIDYTKNLKVVFDVAYTNEEESEPLTDPESYKRYFIEWDNSLCEYRYYFKDMVKDPDVSIPISSYGFLSGITGEYTEENVVSCGNMYNFEFNSLEEVITVDFGTQTGNMVVRVKNLNFPSRYILNWNGVTFDTKYIGRDIYDQQLINYGISPSDIETTPGIAAPFVEMTVLKSSANPRTATLRVLNPSGDIKFNTNILCIE